MFETTRRDGIVQARREGARWLSTAWDGGYRDADAVYNVTVPTGFERTDLDAYRAERLADAGFSVGPTLLTGVHMDHARRADSGPVTVLATAGLSNPAALPMADEAEAGTESGDAADWRPGTVNLVVGADRALSEGALATLLATAVEAKAATLLDVAGVPGTTSDAVLVGSVPDADRVAFTGSATAVGAAARACVRDAVVASLDARYDEGPPGVDEAEYGVITDRQTDVRAP
ncbi:MULTISPECIES: adenosylcobinamide amidohydrolase [Haloarcula]|uniref:Adenosylcobinamide amidohydrolase n=1 Tax=Haloarcula pellucida TaxID=1427151 RepID=A0A830GPT0_9EURY|nr:MULTISPECIES: adenosylcobinamide amidohydrolase [Halomicroarcula]MBX0350303.1 adenosylcobinamide amidohydrolase [Halomicroarcula pellucida]MDS0277595.1 adenosylcobinamide amidohydrolase [Halomicroarcula sp. S1AR25-4]GGO01443.1 adenosylcobinamide amidohydrolase [Halomicroarcula pellucida]